MAYTFKRQIFGFMDLLRFKKMVPTRRKIFQKGSPEPLKKSYKVNETARILHPGYQDGKLKSISLETPDTKTFTFELERPVFFRAGQYVTVGREIDGSQVARPYAISSSPLEGLKKEIAVTVKKAGFFSSFLFETAKEGDVFRIGEPSGEFYFEGLKDSRNVLALAGGSGITPFYSMAQAVKELFHADNPIKTIGIRHGEKMYETLCTSEEMSKAIDLGNFFRVPADVRDLNYSLYADKFGHRTDCEQYNSDNTHRLNVEQMKELLLKLDYVKEELANYKK